jgi:hypothetical protein
MRIAQDSNQPLRQGVSGHLLAITFGFLALFLVTLGTAYSQVQATLSAAVSDPTGAVIPGANVQLINEATGDIRHSVSNGEGYFSFPGLPEGKYTVKISAAGFADWKEVGLTVKESESLTLPNLHLSLGTTNAEVVVTADAATQITTDSGAVGTTLDEHTISELSIVGRDAGEFIKFMPGMGMNAGLSLSSSFGDQVVGTNSGPVGAYAPNGMQPNGSMGYYEDGANILDSNSGTQLSNINSDMVTGVQVMTNSFGADFPQGPTVFQTDSKSGGRKFHGEIYEYARNSDMYSEDAFMKADNLAKPYAFFYYTGGNIGGPVAIPHTNLGSKLFFWVGYENMRQQPTGGISSYFVPTATMRAGDFSAASLAALPSSSPDGDNQVPNTPCDRGTVCPPVKTPMPNLTVSSQATALLSLIPMPTVDPSTHDGMNYLYLNNQAQNRWEFDTRLDYALSANTKMFGSYIHQKETDLHPFGSPWWAAPDALPYPGMVSAPTTSTVATVNITHIFSPTLTNELFGSVIRYGNLSILENKTASERSTIGYTGSELFNLNNPQIPDVVSWGQGIPGWYAVSFDDSNLGGGGGWGKVMRRASVYDNLTGVRGKHTMRAGFYWAYANNEQSSGVGNTQGMYDFDDWSGTGTGNTVADFMLGRAGSYSQASANGVSNLKMYQYDFYAQDSWKVNNRLTLNYGLRATHLGQWFAPGAGLQTWDPSKYDNSVNAGPNTGLVDHATDPSVSLSGTHSTYYFNPRASLAYDVFGTGKTVLRGGFGVYNYQTSASQGNESLAALGLYSYTTPQALNSFNDIANFTPSAFDQNGGNVYAMQKNYGGTPHTETWNVTVSQVLPWHASFEASYIGDRSRSLLIDGDTTANLNAIPAGAFFNPDPVTGVVVSPTNANFNAEDYVPYRNYETLNVLTGGSSANYNGFQAVLQKQQGRATVMMNYSFGKALGTRDGVNDNGQNNGVEVSPVLKDNYGVLSYDHTGIFNATYVYNMPSPFHKNLLLDGAVNGWELSGDTQWQSGAPIQPNANGNLSAQYPSTVSNSTYLGTNAITLMPKLICDPRSGRHSGQYFNPACFAAPDSGANGQYIWPYIKGPSYFNSDLGMYKNFKFTESRYFQFRFSAFNFLNHPLEQFNADGSENDLKLSFIGANNTLSPTNVNTFTTGSPMYKVGSRTIEMALKFVF